MQNKKSSAQGTIEYLVILAVIIVIGLVVVGMLISINDSSSIVSKNNELKNRIGTGGISVVEAVLDIDGDAAITFENISGSNLNIQTLSIGEITRTFLRETANFGKPTLYLSNIGEYCICEEGERSKVCIFELTRSINSGGQVLSQGFPFEINLDCVNDVILNTSWDYNIEYDVPVISLTSPNSDITDSDGLVNFEFDVSDDSGIASCELIVNGVSVATDSDGDYGLFNYTFLNKGTHYWDVNCTDVHANVGSDINSALRIHYPPVASFVKSTENGSGDEWEYGKAVISDSLGNIYVAGNLNGYTESDVNFGGNFTISDRGSGSNDFFVVKYDSNGVTQWVKSPENDSGVGSDEPSDLALDSSNNIYVVGRTSSEILDFGNGVIINRDNYMNFFVVKYDSSGVAQWAKSSENGSGTGNDYGESISIDSLGNIYVAGTTTSSLDFGNSVTLSNNGSSEFFVVKYDSSGVAQWAKSLENTSGNSGEQSQSVSTDSLGNVYVSGNTWSTILDFGNSVTLSNTDGGDFFVVKYDSSGVAQWAKSSENGSVVVPYSGASSLVDSLGNVYVGGHTTSSLDFGNSVVISNDGDYDFFVVKYDSSGVAQWAKSSENGSGTNEDRLYALFVKSNGELFISGTSDSDLNFGNGVNIVTNNSSDFFVVKYDSSGVAQWSKSPENTSGGNYDYVNNLFVDSSNSIFGVGYSGYSSDFGNGVMISYDGQSDFFVVKYN
jgi:hypothetical protein